MSMNELNERDLYEEPGINIFEKMVDGKKEWIHKSTIDALSLADPDRSINGIYRQNDGTYTRISPLQAPPIEDSKGLFESNKIDPLMNNTQSITAAIGSGWFKWVGLTALSLIGLNVMRKNRKK